MNFNTINTIKILAALLLCLSFRTVIAQTKVFCDENGYQADSVSAKYYKYAGAISKEEQGKIYYLNGDIFQETQEVNGRMQTMRYFPNRNIAYKSYFDESRQGYMYQTWYENGQQEKIQIATKEKGLMLIQAWDSLGRQMVKDGNGFFTSYYPNKQKTEEGKYIEGFKTEAWNGWRDDGQVYYEEHWDNGKLLKGISYNKTGEKFEYDQEYVGAEPQGGFKAFYKFMAENLEYPLSARRSGIQGTVILGMVIDTIGNVHDIHIARGISKDCDEACIKLVKSYPKWTPAKEKGQLVKMKTRLPFKFSLN